MKIDLYEGDTLPVGMREVISNRLYLRSCDGNGIRFLCSEQLGNPNRERPLVQLLAIVRDGETAIGCGILENYWREDDSFQVYVRPRWRRHGIGRMILQAICDRKGKASVDFCYYTGTRVSKSFHDHVCGKSHDPGH